MDLKKSSRRLSKSLIFLQLSIWAFSLFLTIKLRRISKFEADVIQFFAMLDNTLLYSIAEVERILVLIVIYLCLN